MKSEFKGNNANVISSVNQANKIMVNNDFFVRIANHKDFDYTDESPKNISKWMNESSLTVKIKLYKDDPDSPTTAYVDSRYPNTLFLNSRKLDRDIAEITNTIVHECVHSVDTSLPNARFGHGDNSPTGKGNSAPYWIGNLAERIVGGKNSSQDDTIINDPIRFIEESKQPDDALIIEKE